MKQLIVNADDFGYAPGVNRGILEAHLTGIVTSTTVMVNFPDAAPGLQQALADAPRLGIGLHLNLTSGSPVCPPGQVPSLVNGRGEFHSFRTWPEVLSRFDAGEIAQELRAQFDRFVTLAGRAPDHLDAHHHAAYLHPAALRCLLELAAEYRLPVRDIRLGSDGEPALAPLHELLPELPQEQAARLADDLRAALDQGPAPLCPARFEPRFLGDRATLGDLLVILTTLPDGHPVELMCHPGYLDAAAAGTTYRRREEELAHLTNRATHEVVAAEGIELTTFGALI